MEITTLSESSVKVKGKQSAFAINPTVGRAKIVASTAVFFGRLPSPFDIKSFEEEPLVIQGPGEYEVGGIKFSGSRVGDSFTYRIVVDGVDILAAKTSSLVKTKESSTEYDILLLEADSLADQSVVTALNPSVIIFYGEKKEENAKAMGKEGNAVSKFSITRDKLPNETQIITLQ